MKRNVFAAAIFGLCCVGVAPLAAQAPDDAPAPPRVLLIQEEQIKEGRQAAHVRTEAAWPRLLEKSGLPAYYIGMTSVTGPSQAWFLEPYESFGQMEKSRAALDHSQFAPELEAATAQDGEHLTGSRYQLTVFRDDLSYNAPQAMKNMPKCRHMAVTVLRVKNGREPDLVQAARMIINGDQLSNSSQPVLVYQVISGGPSGIYLLIAPMESLASMDEAPARTAATRQAMGEHNRTRFDAITAEILESTENLLFTFEPRMSYVPKDFAAASPDFWNPKPAKAKTAAKAVAKR